MHVLLVYIFLWKFLTHSGHFHIMSSAPAAGFEPATNALHVFQYFRIGVDYIFTIFMNTECKHKVRYSGI